MKHTPFQYQRFLETRTTEKHISKYLKHNIAFGRIPENSKKADCGECICFNLLPFRSPHENGKSRYEIMYLKKLKRPPTVILIKFLPFHLSTSQGKATQLRNEVVACYRALERVHGVQVLDTNLTDRRQWVNGIFKGVFAELDQVTRVMILSA